MGRKKGENKRKKFKFPKYEEGKQWHKQASGAGFHDDKKRRKKKERQENKQIDEEDVEEDYE